MVWFDTYEEDLKVPEKAPLRWVIRESQTGKYAGELSIRPVESRENVFWMGYYLAYDHWGKGVMTAAVAAVLDLAPKENVRIITAGVKEGNIGSRRVLEKNGFRMVGEHLEETLVWDFERDL